MKSRIQKKLLSCGKIFPSDGKIFPSENSCRRHLQHLPKGHIRVYVGKDFSSMFELDANYLNHPLFDDLLQLSANEFGYSYQGALKIPCDVDLFLYVVHLLKSGDPSAHYLQFQDLLSRFQASHLKVPDAFTNTHEALDARLLKKTS